MGVSIALFGSSGALNRLQDQSPPPVRARLTPVASSCNPAEEESARGTTPMLRYSKVR